MATTTPRTRRSPEEWDALAQELLPRLQAGEHVSDLANEIGSNDEAFRVALARRGFDPRGRELQLKKISARSPKELARKIAKRRQENAPWWRIMAETDESYARIIQTLTQYGYDRNGEPVSNGTEPEA